MKKDIDCILSERGADALLLYSESFMNANMYYLTGFLSPDPFIFLRRVGDESIIVVNQMEFSRAKRESTVRDVRSYEEYDYASIVRSSKDPRLGMMKFLSSVVKKEIGKRSLISVPHDFPSMALDVLRKEGLNVKPMFDVVEKARETKEPSEIKAIETVQKVVDNVMSEVINLISNCDVDPDGTLVHRENGVKTLLTVGKVKTYIAKSFLENNCIIEKEIIVSCGVNSANPHYLGKPEEKLKAKQPIVIDLYPRSLEKRYWADMTRTIVKGSAPRKIKKMFEVVLEARDTCIDMLHEGVPGSEVYNLCCDIMEKAGYKTMRGGKRIEEGFLHGLGHGVGLEIHEGPYLNEAYKFPLKEHNIVTIEPGLYDPKIGGVRVEDIVEIGKWGCRNLTKTETILEV